MINCKLLDIKPPNLVEEHSCPCSPWKTCDSPSSVDLEYLQCCITVKLDQVDEPRHTIALAVIFLVLKSADQLIFTRAFILGVRALHIDLSSPDM